MPCGLGLAKPEIDGAQGGRVNLEALVVYNATCYVVLDGHFPSKSGFLAGSGPDLGCNIWLRLLLALSAVGEFAAGKTSRN